MATTKKKNEGLSGAAAAAARVALGDAGKVTSSATTSRKASTRTSSGSSSGNTVRNRTNGIDYTVSSGNGIYGVPTINSEKKNYTQNGVTYQAGPIMNRVTDPDIIKNGYYNSNGYTVFVDEDGYAHSASKGVSDYTPHLDINAGNGRYNTSGAWTDNEVLTASDLQKIADIRSQMQAGLITGDKANQMANQIRSGYGYTIDKQGNVTDLLAKSRVDSRRKAWELPTNGMSTEQQNFLNLMFPEQQGYGNEALLSALSGLQNGYQTPTYSDAPTWNGSEWDNVLNALADQLLNMNYTDWTKGDQYQALADRYGQQGRMSMQDVLGQISSRTGGLASSWAATSAQQQYNMLMSQLEDAAMDMYNVERNDLYDRANMARQYAQDDYNRYVDDWNRWADDRNFAYNAYRDSVADQRYEDQLAYERQQDALALQQNTTGTTKPNLTAAQTLTALKNGVVNDTTMSAYEYYFGEPYGGNTAIGTGTDTPKKKGGGYDNGSLSTSEVMRMQEDINKYLPEGEKIAVDGKWGAATKKAADGLTADEYAKEYYRQHSWSGRSDR